MIARRVLLRALILLAVLPGQLPAENLERVWNNPPPDARLRAYWWWLNGNVTSNSITRDLTEMKAKGFGGALICDADGSSQDGNDRAQHGPTFFSPKWRELYKHTLREADRLGLEMSLNIQSGWNLGGPMVTQADAPKKLVWTESRITGPAQFAARLSQPRGRDNFYRDLFVLAYRVQTNLPPNRKPLQNQEQKALLRALEPFSAPDSTPLFQEFPSQPGEGDAQASDIIDLTSKLDPDGTLRWDAPEGEWQVLRLGFTLNDHCRVSTCSQGWDGYAIDPFDAGAFRRYWNAVVEPLIADAGPLAGKSLKYLHTDSWEVEVANWTPTLREEFKQRRGYDLLPWLPVIAGKIINRREDSNRFLHDFRRTMGDLAIDNHFKLFKEGAHKHGLLIHPESGGPHAVPIDAQQCLGFNDAPMSEFWAWSWRHRLGDENRFFVKQPASAAHTYGHKLVLAEGFTTIGPHWQETLWDNLKHAFDHASAEGLNLLVWHAFVCSPASEGLPGQQYFAGTHLNPNVTWWNKSVPFFDYLNRCQALLQQGLFVADVAYYYGDHVPNFSQLRRSDPAWVGRGYDYDVITEEALLTRASVKNGRIVLPDGMSYRVLALPNRTIISLPVLRKVKELVAAGATVVGPKPTQASGLRNAAQSDAEVKWLADELWDKNLVMTNRTAREVLLAKGVSPDFEWSAGLRSGTNEFPASDRNSSLTQIDYVHRVADGAEIYFVANRSTNNVSVVGHFRVSGKVPELWNPVTGERTFAAAYEEAAERTTMPIDFAPCGSWFVIFREQAVKHPAVAQSNSPRFTPLAEIAGPWQVKFDPAWGGPESATFDRLVSWTERPEPGIKFYSGTATYTTTFNLPDAVIRNPQAVLFLDLGNIREIAEVKINGKSCGLVWSPPFRVEITGTGKPWGNKLEVEVVNFWPNRIIGDAALPPEQRRTRTNIRKLTADTKLMPSGLLGPVQILEPAK
ncbi:MAG: glycosyl hydrolase [Verrucomicrobiota bacterium]